MRQVLVNRKPAVLFHSLSRGVVFASEIRSESDAWNIVSRHRKMMSGEAVYSIFDAWHGFRASPVQHIKMLSRVTKFDLKVGSGRTIEIILKGQ